MTQHKLSNNALRISGILDRFLRYVTIDTTPDETSRSTPSSERQRVFLAKLAGELRAMGAADRSGDTDDSGTLRFANMKAGTYRVRFSGDGFITFEREIVVRTGQVIDVDVTLNPDDRAPEPEHEPQQQPPPAEAPPVGPAGEPKQTSILTLLEREIIRREPRKETALGCSGNARSTMIQINEQQPERLYENAEAIYYVIGGDGTVRLNGRENPISTSDYIQVPRGTSHAFVRKGKRPLIILAFLSGEPCSPR